MYEEERRELVHKLEANELRLQSVLTDKKHGEQRHTSDVADAQLTREKECVSC